MKQQFAPRESGVQDLWSLFRQSVRPLLMSVSQAVGEFWKLSLGPARTYEPANRSSIRMYTAFVPACKVSAGTIMQTAGLSWHAKCFLVLGRQSLAGNSTQAARLYWHAIRSSVISMQTERMYLHASASNQCTRTNTRQKRAHPAPVLYPQAIGIGNWHCCTCIGNWQISGGHGRPGWLC